MCLIFFELLWPELSHNIRWPKQNKGCRLFERDSGDQKVCFVSVKGQPNTPVVTFKVSSPFSLVDWVCGLNKHTVKEGHGFFLTGEFSATSFELNHGTGCWTKAELEQKQEWTAYLPSANPCCERGSGTTCQRQKVTDDTRKPKINESRCGWETQTHGLFYTHLLHRLSLICRTDYKRNIRQHLNIMVSIHTSKSFSCGIKSIFAFCKLNL